MSPLLYCECDMCGLALKETEKEKKAKSRYSFNNAMKNEIFTRENFFHEISDEWVETFSKSFIHTKKSHSILFRHVTISRRNAFFIDFAVIVWKSIECDSICHFTILHSSGLCAASFTLILGSLYPSTHITVICYFFISYPFLSLMTKLSTWGWWEL